MISLSCLGPDQRLVRLSGGVPALERQEEAEKSGRAHRPHRRKVKYASGDHNKSMPPMLLSRSMQYSSRAM